MARTHVVKIRVTAAEHGTWRRAAAAAGLPLSTHLRRRLDERSGAGAGRRGAGGPAAPAPLGQPRARLDTFIRIRVTAADREDLAAAADLAGLTLAAYARRRLLGHTVIAAADAAAIRELRRQGGLLKRLHVESRGAYRRRTAAAIDAVRGAIERLAR